MLNEVAENQICPNSERRQIPITPPKGIEVRDFHIFLDFYLNFWIFIQILYKNTENLDLPGGLRRPPPDPPFGSAADSSRRRNHF